MTEEELERRLYANGRTVEAALIEPDPEGVAGWSPGWHRHFNALLQITATAWVTDQP